MSARRVTLGVQIVCRFAEAGLGQAAGARTRSEIWCSHLRVSANALFLSQALLRLDRLIIPLRIEPIQTSDGFKEHAGVPGRFRLGFVAVGLEHASERDEDLDQGGMSAFAVLFDGIIAPDRHLIHLDEIPCEQLTVHEVVDRFKLLGGLCGTNRSWTGG